MNFLSIFLKYSFMKIVKYVREVGPWTGSNPFCPYHRRRIDLEDKAKVVAFAWGAESLPR